MRHNEWIEQWNEFLNTHTQLQIEGKPESLVLPTGDAASIAQHEPFWKEVQDLFPKAVGHINLNNGGVCSNSLFVERAYKQYYSLLNTSPSYFNWKVMEQGRLIIKEGLAALIQCEAEEVALFRNATEALNNAIFGIVLQAGDEVVACRQDYIKCVSSWKQREMREGIKVNWVELNGTESNDEVFEKYMSAITDNTKVLHLTHVINWNGQILPAQRIAEAAKQGGLIVLLDAAHSFAVLETDMQKIPCDYMGVALHKWLSGPIAAGMLFVRKECIAATYPLASAVDPLSNQIGKFEEMSIQVLPNMIALGFAIEFHMQLTREVKEARLNYLRSRWTGALHANKKIQFHVPLNVEQCCAIANFAIEGKDPLQFEQYLFDNHKIHVVGFEWPNLSGIRITPNIYTPIEDVERFVEVMGVAVGF